MQREKDYKKCQTCEKIVFGTYRRHFCDDCRESRKREQMRSFWQEKGKKISDEKIAYLKSITPEEVLYEIGYYKKI